MTKHPLADYVRIVARGEKASRHYTYDEARTVMSMMLAEDYRPEQLGAIFMLLRVMGEEADELAGFAAAINELWPEQAQEYDLVWSSYAGKRRQPLWNLLSAKLLTQLDYRVLVHGCEAHTPERTYAADVFDYFHWHQIKNPSDWNSNQSLVYLPCRTLNSNLQEWLNLKFVLGVRSPMNTVLKTITPKGVPSVQGIFHPVYTKLHSQAEAINGGSMMVLKGEGGEFEVNPERTAKVTRCILGEIDQGIQISNQKSVYEGKPVGHTPDLLQQAWRGDLVHDYIDRAVIDTAALGLCAIEPTMELGDAQQRLTEVWQQRDKKLLG